jgi:beta-glucosidase
MRRRRCCLLSVLAGALALGAVDTARAAAAQPEIGTRVAPLLQVEGLLFKDLNKNGRLDAYEDWRRPVDERVADLVSQMTVEEKAGLMVGPTLEMGPGGTLNEQAIYRPNPFTGGPPVLYAPGTSEAILRQHMRQFINRSNADPRTMATWLNAVQAVAEGSRLGVPAFFVTNPRHHLSGVAQFGVNETAGSLSQWPGSLGLAATRDAALVEEFARIAAREYVAVGIRGAYHPQVDLATEPRWARVDGTLGEDPKLSAELARALVRGFQGKTLGPHSVALTVKHFPGGGPAREGLDSHFSVGRFAVYPGGRFDEHVEPFRAAVEEGVACVMPYYSIPKDRTTEAVGMAFNREIVTDLLRGKLGFAGIVNSDSGIMTSMVWGVESLSVKERYKKALDAGTDLIGSDGDPAVLVDLVKAGALPESRLDESVRRILRVRFALGIFENPYASPDEAARVVRSAESRAKADLAQRRSIVLLKNDKAVLPLKPGARFYVEGIDPAVAAQYGYVSTAGPETADLCIVRLTVGAGPSPAPRRGPAGAVPEGFGAELRRAGAGGLLQNAGGQPIDLTVPAEPLERVRALMRARPTVVSVHFDRPYVIPEIARESAALVATFGASDAALLDVLTGRFAPTGKLPFELPSSMEAVRAQKEDVPYDSKDPLFPFGAGLTYEAKER